MADDLRVRPGFVVEQFVGAPLVENPIAVEWDSRGRLWVVEARGCVKVIADSEHAVVFADGLGRCGGVFPWRTGMIVATAKEVLFLEDKDGDGRADVQKVLFVGAVTGFDWGLDGWLYAVRDGHDFRFHPDTAAIEPLAGESENGRRRDDWGNWYGNGDGKWLWHYSFDARYLRQKMDVSLRTTLANYGDAANVYPDGKAVPAGKAGSFTPYRDELFGLEFATTFFICDPLNHIVHREVLAQDGVSFLSRRSHDETHSEFLVGGAPVMVRTAPDGSLVVVDEEKGIYRIVPTGTKLRAVPNLAAMDNAGLVRALHSVSGWQRDTAQRLLIERAGNEAVPELRRIVRLGKIPKARLQALATLDTLGAMDDEDVRAGLRDRQYAPIRTQAIRLSEKLAADATVLDDFPPFLDDPDICVRRQLALSLGKWSDPRATAMLTTLAEKIPGQPDLRPAVLSSLKPGDPLVKRIIDGIKPPPPAPKFTSPEREKIAASYGSVAALKGDTEHGRVLFLKHCAECHRAKNDGTEVGPSISAERPLGETLMSLFDPSAVVELRYLENRITLKDGSVNVGVIVAESVADITLRVLGGREVKLSRAEMTSQQALGKSLMPEGFETKLGPQDVADLLGWLQAK